MNYVKRVLLLCGRPVFAALAAAAVLVSAVSCDKDPEGIDNGDKDYGYVQFKVYKRGGTWNEGSEPVTDFRSAGMTRAAGDIDYLAQVGKIKITFSFNNQRIVQTMNVTSSNPEAAEYGLRTEKLKLLAGEYTLVGYEAYNKVGDVIQSGSLTGSVSIKEGGLTIHNLEIGVTLRGEIKFALKYDYSAIEAVDPESGKLTRAAEDYPETYTFSQVDRCNITLLENGGDRVALTGLKAKLKDGKYILDSLVSIPAGTYTLKEYAFYPKSGGALEARDDIEGVEYVVEDNRLCEADVPVTLRKTDPKIGDYLALRAIWEATDGPNWYYRGEGAQTGANWDFDKPIDQWGEQVGVGLNDSGRVVSLAFGSFNPKGVVPDCIGDLSELQQLYLGSHTDFVPEDQGSVDMPYSISSFYLSRIDREITLRDRLDLGLQYYLSHSGKLEREKSKVARPYAKMAAEKGISTYALVDYGVYTNRLSGKLPETLNNLKKLAIFHIANGEITHLPTTMAGMESLTDFEIYNCQHMTEFPDQIAELPTLISLQIGYNYQWDGQDMFEGLKKIFDSKAAADEFLQLLYLNDCNLTALPDNITNVVNLKLLDASNNKITALPKFGKLAPIQLIMDNNLLTDLPRDPATGLFCTMGDVEMMSFTYNKFTKMPDVFSAKSKFVMGTIDFSFNKIEGLENYDAAAMKGTYKGINCNSLNLSNNNISGMMPAAFSQTGSVISSLNLNTNNLDSIPAPAVDTLYNLTLLDLSGNRLRSIPGELNAINVPYLEQVDLSYNRFSEFPLAMFNIYRITKFFFNSQYDDDGSRCFTKWPENIHQHPTLRVFQVSGNDIRTIKNFPTLLSYLDISDNPNLLTDMPAYMCERLTEGSFTLIYDTSQKIRGCDILGIEN